MALAGLCALLFVLVRLAAFGWDASRFVVAGDHWVSRAAAPHDLWILRSSDGYDGTFYYRLALDPWTAKRTLFGITLDAPAYRQQRILYPLLAYLVSGGRPAAAAWALIVLNVAAVAMLGWIGGALARDRGRPALWGLALPAYPGLVLAVARDLGDVVAVCALAAGLLFTGRRRWVPAAVAFALAALARETTVVVPAALGVVWAWDLVRARHGRRPGPARAPVWLFALPLAVEAAWQVVLWRHWGTVPLLQGQGNLGLPFVGLAHLAGRALAFHAVSLAVRFAELVFVAVASAAVALSLRSSRAPRYEKLAWLVSVAIVVVLSQQVWVEDWAYLRAFAEGYLLGTAVLLGRRDAWGAPVFAFAALLCLAVAGLHVARP
jgi:hypothetical protein